MKNIRETKALPFLALLSPEDRSLVKDETIPESLKSAADSLGVAKPSDNVDFTLSLGSVIFDIYHTQTEMPKAPLAQEKERAKRLKLAEELDKEEFEIPTDVKGVLEKTLSEDTEWGKVAISTHYKVGSETRMLQLSSVALDIFGDTKKALMSMFL